jgi:hypothetical protein
MTASPNEVIDPDGLQDDISTLLPRQGTCSGEPLESAKRARIQRSPNEYDD